jgi:anti-sigma factor RsiW
MQSDCDHLDDFLSGDLPDSKAGRFTAHLASCEHCRAEVDEERWIERLLQSSERLELESPSPALLEDIRSTLTKSRQHAGVLAYGLAAAVVLITAGWIALSGRTASKVQDEPVADISSPLQFARAVVSGENMIVVPIAYGDPDVTVVRLFPTYPPDGDQIVEANPASAKEFDDSLWSQELHGDTL